MMADAYARTSGDVAVLTCTRAAASPTRSPGSRRRRRAAPRCWCWPRTPRARRCGPTSASTRTPRCARSARCRSGCTRPRRPSTTSCAPTAPACGSGARWCSTCRSTSRPPRASCPTRCRGGAVGCAARRPRRRWRRSPRCSTGRERPVFIAGRGARHAGPAVAALAERCGALLATSAVANGLFAGDAWSLGISGGFATPLAVELIAGADLVVAWGASLTMWTTRHGALIGPDATVVQVDDDPAALGAQRPVHLGVLGDVGATARDVLAAVAGGPGAAHGGGRQADRGRGPVERPAAAVRAERTAGSTRGCCRRRWTTCCPPRARWASIPATSWATRAPTSPCPTRPGSASRRRSSRSGWGWPPRWVRRWPGRTGCRSPRSATAASSWASPSWRRRSGWGWACWSSSTTTRATGRSSTTSRDDDHGTVRFPETDLAAIAAGFGCAAATVRAPADLAVVREWLAGPRDRPLLLDAKVRADEPLLVAGRGVQGPLTDRAARRFGISRGDVARLGTAIAFRHAGEENGVVITGAHAILYSTDADADRAFLRDLLGTTTVDAGGGWLILALPPAEVAVHPTDGPAAARAVPALRRHRGHVRRRSPTRGVVVEGGISDQGGGG